MRHLGRLIFLLRLVLLDQVVQVILCLLLRLFMLLFRLQQIFRLLLQRFLLFLDLELLMFLLLFIQQRCLIRLRLLSWLHTALLNFRHFHALVLIFLGLPLQKRIHNQAGFENILLLLLYVKHRLLHLDRPNCISKFSLHSFLLSFAVLVIILVVLTLLCIFILLVLL